jgi:hypothetical protein
MISRWYVHTEPSIKTLGPVTFAVDVPYQSSPDAVLSFIASEMAKNLHVDKSRLTFTATGPIDFLVKVLSAS